MARPKTGVRHYYGRISAVLHTAKFSDIPPLAFDPALLSNPLCLLLIPTDQIIVLHGTNFARVVSVVMLPRSVKNGPSFLTMKFVDDV
jgi:hypothetical protein